MRAHYVDTDAALAVMNSALESARLIAIDTEFIREKTYYPNLCLIQLAANDEIWCVDPLAIEDLSSLFTLLAERSRVKIFHAGRQDLEIFFNLTEAVPGPIFDTQVAAALLGRPDQIAYAGLVSEFFSIDLDKSLSRTDWTKRPLNPAQLGYAADDVRYLAELKEYLSTELDTAGRAQWLVEECSRLELADLYAADPANAWQRLKGIGKLEAPAHAVAVRLAGWREMRAKDRNLPRGWVLKDDRVLALARAAPKTLAELGAIDGLAPGLIRRAAQEILDTINTPTIDEAQDAPGAPAILTAADKKLVQQLQLELRESSAREGVAAGLISTRREIEQAVYGQQSLRMFSGWRAQIFGQQVLDRLAQHSGGCFFV